MTLTILGIVASLIVPGIVKRQTEITNKTKLKKALAVYESFINKLIVENNLPRTKEALDSFTKGDSSCANIRKYFKIVKTTKNNSCRFMTSDGVWYFFNSDNAPISKPMVGFKEEKTKSSIASMENDFNSFYFITTFDENGSVRVNDLANAYDKNDVERILAVSKVQAFLNGKSVYDYLKHCGDGEAVSCVVLGKESKFYDSNGHLIKRNGCAENGYNCTWAQRFDGAYNNELGGHLTKITSYDSTVSSANKAQFQFYPDSLSAEDEEMFLNVGNTVFPDLELSMQKGTNHRIIYNCSSSSAKDFNDSSCTKKQYLIEVKDTSGNSYGIMSSVECFEEPKVGCKYENGFGKVWKEL